MHHSTSTNCSRRGLTLIEVVAGLALMGTLLAAMLSAKSNFTRQHRHAQRVLAAVAAADDLLMNHWQDIRGLEGLGAGGFNQHDDLIWTATRINDSSANDWYCKIVRVQVMDAAGGPGDPPLVSVDLLVPDASAIPSRTEAGHGTDDEGLEEPPNVTDVTSSPDHEDELDVKTLQKEASP